MGRRKSPAERLNGQPRADQRRSNCVRLATPNVGGRTQLNRREPAYNVSGTYRQLPAERGPESRPSANDFQVFDLIRIVDRFATDFDDLPELIPGRPDYRILVSAGMLVPPLAVVGQLAPDGAMELVQRAFPDTRERPRTRPAQHPPVRHHEHVERRSSHGWW